MLQSPSMGQPKTNRIVSVDVFTSLSVLPEHIRKVLHKIQQQSTMKAKSKVGKFSEAFHFVETLSTAKVVITQRIHTALPCVAMGVPVIFLNSANLPGILMLKYYLLNHLAIFNRYRSTTTDNNTSSAN